MNEVIPQGILQFIRPGEAFFLDHVLKPGNNRQSSFSTKVCLDENCFEFIPGVLIDFSCSKERGNPPEGNLASAGESVHPFAKNICHRLEIISRGRIGSHR
jgi:hypothetical protein